MNSAQGRNNYFLFVTAKGGIQKKIYQNFIFFVFQKIMNEIQNCKWGNFQ